MFRRLRSAEVLRSRRASTRISSKQPSGLGHPLVRHPFDFPLPSSIFGGIVSVNEDRFGTGEWRVEYFDDDGGCYITIFAGPAAERRARDYFTSLQSGRLSIQREPLPR